MKAPFLHALLVLGALLFMRCEVAIAQQWTERVRGSWVGDDKTADGVVLADGNGACDIVVADSENSAVKQAAAFLAGDIEKISGKKPRIVSKQTDGKTAIVIFTAPQEPGDNAKWPWTFGRGDWEAYQIRTAQNAVFLAGSSFRGAAFAAYTLSERLGIDPLHHWTGYEPEHHNPLVLKKTDHSSGPPTFKYRGMFHDDEDILPRPFENAGYPLRTGDVPTEWYAKYFETALRLRMNMVAPYTRVHRRYEVQKMASDWGLFYTSHHYDILLSNPFGIERYGLGKERNLNGPWDWFANRDGMLRYWRGGVDENKEINCIWPVGMRGTDDTGYAFPKGMSDAEQAKIFKEVIDEQVRMTKAALPKDKQAIFHWTLYTEMLPKYQSGKLEVPDDVIIVWPDDNDGNMRGLPEKKDRWKHGVYYHLAYLGKQVKQSAHIVPPARIAEQFKRIVDAGATEYMLVNVSELREFVMEARMLAEICWDAKTALAGGDAGDRYVKWWCREYFGDPAAKDAYWAYSQYYQLFDSYEKQWLGSELFHEALRSTARELQTGKKLAATEPAFNFQNRREGEVFLMQKSCEDAAAAMSHRQRQFFFEHVELPLRLETHAVKAAFTLTGQPGVVPQGDVWTRCDLALEELGQAEADILRAERPPFEEWYRETWIRRGPKPINLHRNYRELRLFMATDGKQFDLADPEPARRRAAAAATTSAPATPVPATR